MTVDIVRKRSMFAVTWGAATDVGRVRGTNEDSLLARPPVFVVADGMGGHTAGEVASALAVEAFAGLAEQEVLRREDVTATLATANETIVAAASNQDDRPTMGTTVTGLCLVNAGGSDHILVFNIGDSRVYRFSDGELDQVTVDHSEVQELVTAGRLSREEARVHRGRNIVTRSLGTEPAPEADLWLLPPFVGDRYLLCSDGLSTEVGDRDLASLLSAVGEPERVARSLVEAAVAAGGRDNVTVVVVDVVSVDTETTIDEATAPKALLPALEESPLITEVPGARG